MNKQFLLIFNCVPDYSSRLTGHLSPLFLDLGDGTAANVGSSKRGTTASTSRSGEASQELGNLELSAGEDPDQVGGNPRVPVVSPVRGDKN